MYYTHWPSFGIGFRTCVDATVERCFRMYSDNTRLERQRRVEGIVHNCGLHSVSRASYRLFVIISNPSRIYPWDPRRIVTAAATTFGITFARRRLQYILAHMFAIYIFFIYSFFIFVLPDPVLERRARTAVPRGRSVRTFADSFVFVFHIVRTSLLCDNSASTAKE